MKRIAHCILFISVVISLNAQISPESYLKGMALIKTAAYDSAVTYLNEAIIQKPNKIDYRMERGIVFFELRQYDLAIKDFLLVNQKQKGRAGFMLAKAECRLHHPELAIKYLREHLASKYRVNESDILLDSDLQKLENHRAWISLWKEKEWYNNYDRQLQEVKYLKSLKNYPEALDILNKLDKSGYKRSIIKTQKSEIFKLNGNLKAAIKEAESATKTDYKNESAKQLLIGLYLENEDYEKASEICKQLLRIQPAAFDYYLISGKLYSQLGNYTEAISIAENYTELFPMDDKGYATLGEIHFDNKKYLSALKSINKALEFNQSFDKYYLLRGKIYAATNTHIFAIKDYSMALDLNPYNADTWYSAGISEMKNGNKKKACFAFKKALQYGKFESREYIESLCEE